MLRVRVAATAQSTLWRLVAEAEIGVRGGRTGQVRCDAELAVADVRDVAPPEDEASVRGRVERAVRALAATGDNDAARALLQAVIADERDALMRTAGMERAHAAFYGALLTLAYFLDCVGAGSKAHASCVAFAADMLQGVLRADGSSTWNSFFLDGERLFFSDAVFDAARDLLGQAHPLIQSLDALVVAPRAAAAEEEEWPDESSIRSARIADAQQAAPVPERVWAMRNAAGTLPNRSSKPPPGLSLTCLRPCVRARHACDDGRTRPGGGSAVKGGGAQGGVAGLRHSRGTARRAVRLARRPGRCRRSCRCRGCVLGYRTRQRARAPLRLDIGVPSLEPADEAGDSGCQRLSRARPCLFASLPQCTCTAHCVCLTLPRPAAARILGICETVAETHAAAGRVQDAIDVLEGAASEYPSAAGGRAARLRARAAALGSSGAPPARAGVVAALAAALAPALEVRKTSKRS
jgi:hypothetical protein